jgi:hypothetical protein
MQKQNKQSVCDIADIRVYSYLHHSSVLENEREKEREGKRKNEREM